MANLDRYFKIPICGKIVVLRIPVDLFLFLFSLNCSERFPQRFIFMLWQYLYFVDSLFFIGRQIPQSSKNLQFLLAFLDSHITLDWFHLINNQYWKIKGDSVSHVDYVRITTPSCKFSSFVSGLSSINFRHDSIQIFLTAIKNTLANSQYGSWKQLYG